MMLELSRGGHHDEACRLVNLRTVPSWGYTIDMGATTIWERWDGYVKGRGFQSPGMNSFNHWAFGSVGEWIWRELAGINPDEEHPGYKHFTSARGPAGLHLGPGRVRVDSRPDQQRLAHGRRSFHLEVADSAGPTATVYFPAATRRPVPKAGTKPPECRAR